MSTATTPIDVSALNQLAEDRFNRKKEVIEAEQEIHSEKTAAEALKLDDGSSPPEEIVRRRREAEDRIEVLEIELSRKRQAAESAEFRYQQELEQLKKQAVALLHEAADRNEATIGAAIAELYGPNWEGAFVRYHIPSFIRTAKGVASLRQTAQSLGRIIMTSSNEIDRVADLLKRAMAELQPAAEA